MSAPFIVGWALAKLFGGKLLSVLCVALCGRWTVTTYGRERVFWYIAAAINILLVALLWTCEAVSAGDLLKALNL